MSVIPEIELVYPEYNSPLTNTILELEKLRQKHRYIDSEVEPWIFFQLQNIFHLLESVGSVRIEGNNTTISEYVEHTITKKVAGKEEKMAQIDNIQKALDFLDENIKENSKIDMGVLLHLHKIVVEGLKDDGDDTPGLLRTRPVKISHSKHVPPHPSKVPELIEKLLFFINSIKDSKDHLISIALSHHRFAWIHPFHNGNGRVVRLLTYAMLIQQGFPVEGIINPTAVFCNDRDDYYEKLAVADKYNRNSQLEWVEYVLTNLLGEMNKIDSLLDKDFLMKKIIEPALKDALSNKYITDEEYIVLAIATDKARFQAGDIAPKLNKKFDVEVSRILNNLKKKSMIETVPGKKRVYRPRFQGNYLVRSLIGVFKKENYVGFSDEAQ